MNFDMLHPLRIGQGIINFVTWYEMSDPPKPDLFYVDNTQYWIYWREWLAWLDAQEK